MPPALDLATVDISFFEPLCREQFSAQPFEGDARQPSADLELVRAVSNPVAARENGRIPFSLFFHGPAGVTASQGLYLVSHPQTGEMLLFLVPVGRKDDRLQLQAVFN